MSSSGNCRPAGYVLLMVMAEAQEDKGKCTSTYQAIACAILPAKERPLILKSKCARYSLRGQAYYTAKSNNNTAEKYTLPTECRGTGSSDCLLNNTLIYTTFSGNEKPSFRKWDTGNDGEMHQSSFHMIHHPLLQCILLENCTPTLQVVILGWCIS